MDNLLEYIGYYIIISHFGEIGFGGASIVRRYKNSCTVVAKIIRTLVFSPAKKWF